METYVHKVFIKEEKNLNMLPEDEEDLKEDTELFENSLSSPTNIKSELQDEGTFLNVANLKEECPNSFSEDENQCPNEAIQQDKESALKVECMHFENDILPVQVKLEISNSNCINASDASGILPTEEQETNNFSDGCKLTSSMLSDGGEKEYTRPEEQLPDVVLSCTYCGLMFFSSLSLSQHEQVCKNNIQSSEIYIEDSQSKNHHNKYLGVNTDEKLILCEICHKTFTRRSGLRQHINSVHEKQRTYKCDLCTISFAELSNLKCHMRSHNKEKPFSCRICDTKFASSSGLKRHSRIHTGDKPYICNTCDKSFTSSTSLNKHTKIHTGDKPHSCSTCNKKFISKGHLAEHVRSHTGEKPFSCSLCDKKFRRRSHIAEHMSLHTNKKTTFL